MTKGTWNAIPAMHTTTYCPQNKTGLNTHDRAAGGRIDSLPDATDLSERVNKKRSEELRTYSNDSCGAPGRSNEGPLAESLVDHAKPILHVSLILLPGTRTHASGPLRAGHARHKGCLGRDGASLRGGGWGGLGTPRGLIGLHPHLLNRLDRRLSRGPTLAQALLKPKWGSLVALGQLQSG